MTTTNPVLPAVNSPLLAASVSSLVNVATATPPHASALSLKNKLFPLRKKGLEVVNG